MNKNTIKHYKFRIGKSYVMPVEYTTINESQIKAQKILEDANSKSKQLVGDAETQSTIILETAKNEATRIIEDARKKAQTEYNETIEKAHKEGFAKGETDGLNQFKEDSVKALKALETLVKSEFEIKKNIIDSATIDMVELICTIADKVCHATFDPQMLYQLTSDAIKQLSNKESITIIANPVLIDAITAMSESFRNEFQSIDSIKIREDSAVTPDGVIVETLDTRLDARISAQIKEIAQNLLTGINDEVE